MVQVAVGGSRYFEGVEGSLSRMDEVVEIDVEG